MTIGARCVGGVLTAAFIGILIRWVPYWHLNFISLVSFTIGWIIYATAVEGWMLVISRILAGVFTGMHYTITYAYFGESFEDYVAAQKELDNYGGRQAAVKDLLFALHGIAMYLAYIAALGEFTVRLCITALHIYML